MWEEVLDKEKKEGIRKVLNGRGRGKIIVKANGWEDERERMVWMGFGKRTDEET
jgi:hypothetical protein